MTDTEETSIGPEAGVTYTLRLYDQNGTLVRTETGLTGTSYTWSTEDTDSGLPSGEFNSNVRVRLNAVRGGIDSHQGHDYTFDRAGYGFNYGFNYGAGN